eukprot:9434415-Ditylum_brightwellii.AAC.1
MKNMKFSLHVDDDAAGFLGIELDRQDDRTIELKQSALIQRIVDTIGFQHANGESTPAVLAELPADHEGLGLQEAWSYPSVVGMLLYLAGTTRPDITMAVHQCERYLHNPRHCHEKAVKRIVHYLISTKNTCPGKEGFRGMIVDPSDDLTLD